MQKLTFVTCAAAVAICFAGVPQAGFAQEETDQEQSQRDQEQEVEENDDQEDQDEERDREESQRQDQQRQQQERERRDRQEREHEQEERNRQGGDQDRQQQDDQQYQDDQQDQRLQQDSQQDRQQQQSQGEDRFQQDQRFRQDQQFRDEQRFGRDRRFGQQQRFEIQTQQQGELGVRLQDYGDRLVISEVRDQSLAAQAGLRTQDIIVSIDGRPVRTPDQFRQTWMAIQREGGRIPVVILRDGERQTIYLEADRFARDSRRPRDSDYYGGEEAWLGVVLDPRFEDYTVVRRVYPGSAADQAGIREGDWIIGINNRRVQSPGHLSQIISNMRPGEQIDIQVARRVTQSVSTRLGDMSERFGEDRFARGPQGRFQDRFDRRDQRFQSDFRTDDEFRSGYRGFDDQDVYVEEGFQQDQRGPQQFDQQGFRQDQNRGGLRDRFNRDEERGLRGRLDRDQQRDRLFDNRNQ